jgi:prolyl oligopeptidase
MLHHRTASRTTLTLSALCLLLACRPAATTPPADQKPGEAVTPTDTGAAPKRGAFVYPPSKQEAVSDDYHGTRVADPYRWLEEPDSADSRAWIEAQNQLTFGYLDEIKERAAIRARLTKLWNFERYGLPVREGGRVFFSKNDGLQNQSVLYVAESLTGEPRVLLDPNTLSADGTVALSGTAYSADGKRMAYGLSSAGSDWQEWRVRDVTTGKDLPDLIKWVKFSGAAWTKDGKGFFYSRYDEPGREDGAAGQEREPEALLSPPRRAAGARHPDLRAQGQAEVGLQRRRHRRRALSGDQRVGGLGRQERAVHAGPQGRGRQGQGDRAAAELRRAVRLRRQRGAGVLDDDDTGAPRGRLIAVDTRKANAADPASWTTIVPEAAETLRGASMVGGRFFPTI